MMPNQATVSDMKYVPLLNVTALHWLDEKCQNISSSKCLNIVCSVTWEPKDEKV